MGLGGWGKERKGQSLATSAAFRYGVRFRLGQLPTGACSSKSITKCYDAASLSVLPWMYQKVAALAAMYYN